MPQAQIGMRVMVDMAGFSKDGVSMGTGASMGGTITAIGPQGITVQLFGTVAGVNVVTVDPSRVTAA